MAGDSQSSAQTALQEVVEDTERLRAGRAATGMRPRYRCWSSAH
ncbi:hypothetical protein ACFFWA_36765 [Actinomadura verrucosospora]